MVLLAVLRHSARLHRRCLRGASGRIPVVRYNRRKILRCFGDVWCDCGDGDGALAGYVFGALGQVKASFEQHSHIVEAFNKSDGEAAAQAMLAHMRPASDAKGLTDFIVNLPKEVLAR